MAGNLAIFAICPVTQIDNHEAIPESRERVIRILVFVKVNVIPGMVELKAGLLVLG